MIERFSNTIDSPKLSHEAVREKVTSLSIGFKNHYSSLKYIEEPSVKICSGIDPTVRFVGSHISVLKPYLSTETIPEKGIFIVQNCLRTRNVDKLLDDNFSPNWGSYFSSLGALTRPEKLDETCNHVFDFFEKKLNIPTKDILVRVSSSDADLLNVCKNRKGLQLEIDSKKPEYYKHKIGMDSVSGRNFNIALKDKNGQNFSDVGNIILLETAKKQLAVETALGSSTILKQLLGLSHVQDCTPVGGLDIENEAIKRKFEDAIITSTVLFSEGLRPFGQHNRNRILRQYIRSMSYFRGKAQMSTDVLSKLILDFEKKELNMTESVANTIVEFIKSFENELLAKTDLSEEDVRIKEVLKFNLN